MFQMTGFYEWGKKVAYWLVGCLITLKLYYVQLFQRNGTGSCMPCQNDLLGGGGGC